MKIILVIMKYDYGIVSRGLSGDFYFFEEPLKKLGVEVKSFDYMSVLKEKGKEAMNAILLDLVRSEKPEITIFVPFTDQFIPEILDEIKNQTTTLVYYFDDVWRIKYSEYWSKHYTFATTSDINGIKKWTDLGCNNFIYSPFGCNHRYFKEKNLPKIYPVTFVGGYHPYRAWLFKRLKKAGIRVNVFGHGWPNGRVDHAEMVNIFNQSQINLNLSNNESWDIRYILSLKKGLKNNLRTIRNIVLSSANRDTKTKEMIKARHFEINACGGFQLSYYTEGLERQYQIGREIAIYGSVDDMIDKIRYYLRHEDERILVAQSGYAKTIKHHTMDIRLSDLLVSMGIKN